MFFSTFFRKKSSEGAVKNSQKISQMEKKGKARTQSQEIDADSTDTETLSGEESDASYLYSSAESGDEEDGAQDELDYFGNSDLSQQEEQDSSVSEAAWEDSDEDGENESDKTSYAPWLTSTGLKKTLEKKTRKISFVFSRDKFSTKHKIKLFKIFGDFMVAVDSFNVIYILKSLSEFSAYKIDRFSISDFVLFQNRLLFCSATCSFLKELTQDGKIKDYNKRVGNITKMACNERLYTVGDQLSSFDKNMNLRDSFKEKFIDICLDQDKVICMKENGDILCFSDDLKLLFRISHDLRFSFKRIFAAHGYYYVSTDTGLLVLDRDFKDVKKFENLQHAPTCFSHNDNFVVHGSDDVNSFRILKDGLVYHDKFPFSRVKIPSLSAIAFSGDTAYLCHSRFISTLRIFYS